jgi:hypothetical protein
MLVSYAAGFFELDVELEDVEAAVQRWAAYVDTLQATKCVGGIGVGADVCAGTVPEGLEAEPEPEESGPSY